MNHVRKIDRAQIEKRAIRQLQRGNAQGYATLLQLAMQADSIVIDQ